MKKLYWLPIAVIIFCGTSCGQDTKPGDQKSITVPAFDSTKYIPQPIGWTNDFVHLFSKTETDTLDSLISGFEQKSTYEISVATVDSAMMGPIEFTSYARLMMRTWGIGKKEKNNGLLIVIAPALRRIRIQNGYGTEKVLSNEETASIINKYFIPKYKDGKFYEGTKEGIIAIIDFLGKTSL